MPADDPATTTVSVAAMETSEAETTVSAGAAGNAARERAASATAEALSQGKVIDLTPADALVVARSICTTEGTRDT